MDRLYFHHLRLLHYLLYWEPNIRSCIYIYTVGKKHRTFTGAFHPRTGTLLSPPRKWLDDARVVSNIHLIPQGILDHKHLMGMHLWVWAWAGQPALASLPLTRDTVVSPKKIQSCMPLAAQSLPQARSCFHMSRSIVPIWEFHKVHFHLLFNASQLFCSMKVALEGSKVL